MMTAAVLFVCVLLCALAVVAATVGGLVFLVGRSLKRNARLAVGSCVAAAVPGLVFVVHAVSLRLTRPGSVWEPYNLWTFIPAALWVLVGPLFLLRSVMLARPLSLPGRVDAIRLLSAVGWVASSVLTVVYGSFV